MSNIASILQKLQQLQLQKKTVAASVNSIGQNAVFNLMQDLRSQQETLISQLALNNPNAANVAASNAGVSQNDPSIIDPAILGAAGVSNSNKPQSIWGDVSGNFNYFFRTLLFKSETKQFLSFIKKSQGLVQSAL